jgi:hypothetical protein
MKRSTWMGLGVALLISPGALSAQDTVPRRHDATLQEEQPATWRRATVHWGKWLAAAGAAALTAMAAQQHGLSQRQWDRLLALCRANNADCVVGPDGHYLNAAAEEYYERSAFYDRRANTRLLGAQLAVIASAALFILDHRYKSDRPENIPLHRLRLSAAPTSDGAQVEMRIAF